MSNVAKGLCWAGSFILLALGNRFGLVEDKTANVLFIVLPVVMIISLRGSNSCGMFRRAA
jgi:hypothetical protein